MAARWELSLRIRKQRLDQGLSVDDVVGALGFSRAYWSAVENDRTVLSDHRFQQVLDILDLTEDQRDLFRELRISSRRRGWWDDHSDLLTNEAVRLFGLEDGASSIRCYESSIVPGLLQAEDYAAYLIENYPSHAPGTVARRVEIRRQRQQLLVREDPPHLTAVIGEAVLHKIAGTREILIDQLRHLVQLSEELPSSLEIRVVPFSTPSGPATGPATLVLFDFEGSDVMPTVAYREAISSITVDTGTIEVAPLEIIYTAAMEASLGPEESLAMIREQIERLEARSD